EDVDSLYMDLVRAAVRSSRGEGGVVWLGGGAVTSAETRELLRQHPVVFLTVSPEAVGDRIRSGNRPLLAGEDPVARWTQIYEQRRGWYEEVATTSVDTARRPMHRIAEEIAKWRRALA